MKSNPRNTQGLTSWRFPGNPPVQQKAHLVHATVVCPRPLALALDFVGQSCSCSGRWKPVSDKIGGTKPIWKNSLGIFSKLFWDHLLRWLDCLEPRSKTWQKWLFLFNISKLFFGGFFVGKRMLYHHPRSAIGLAKLTQLFPEMSSPQLTSNWALPTTSFPPSTKKVLSWTIFVYLAE